MSKVLGPIHYWLYEKIGRQERLTEALAERAVRDGLIERATDYVCELPALESVIDEGNIHGWLQARIDAAEARYSALVTSLLNADADCIYMLLDEAFLFGRENALEADTDARGAYQRFEDFFVNGMPCDRVNTLTKAEADEVCWTMTTDVHKKYWQQYAGSSEPYYRLRRSVMDGMLDNTPFRLVDNGGFQYRLVRS